MPAINGGHRLSCCCAGRRSCRRGGALCWECPSAAGRASARRWTGWSVSWSEQRPGDRAGGGKRAPHVMQVRWTRVPYTRPTPLSHPPERSHAPTCTRPNHTHMIVICRRRTHTSITPSHTHTHLPGCQWSHVDTHGGRSQSSARGFGSLRCHLRLRGHTLLAADGRRLRRSRSGGTAAAPGFVLEASEAQELAHSGLLVLLQDQSRQR